jgi:hypothetical protein
LCVCQQADARSWRAAGNCTATKEPFSMILTNNLSLPVFWRAFNVGDTLYAFGLRDGWVAPGATATYEHTAGHFQMEFKSGAPGHPFLRFAGETYRNDDELFITPEGQVLRFEQTFRIERDPGERREIVGRVTNFFDKLAFDGDFTEEITTSISNVLTSNGTVSTRTTSSAASEVAAGTGGEVTGKGAFQGIEIGVKFNGNVSSKVSQSTSQELSNSHGLSSVQTTSASRKMPLVLRGRTLTAIHWVWERFFVTGRTVAGGRTFEWEVTTRLEASYRLEQYGSVAALPPDVFEAYREKYPASGLSLLRPGTPFLVDGNGWIGTLRLHAMQADGSFDGAIYGQPVRGTWNAGAAALGFTRTIHPTYLQHWEARVASDTDVRGTFQEEIGGMRNAGRYSWRMATRLSVVGNGHAGTLELGDIGADGRFTGRIYGDPVSGQWDQPNGLIRFTRTTANPNYAQEWEGRRTGELTFGGTFRERVGGAVQPTVFNWTAQP